MIGCSSSAWTDGTSYHNHIYLVNPHRLTFKLVSLNVNFKNTSIST